MKHEPITAGQSRWRPALRGGLVTFGVLAVVLAFRLAGIQIPSLPLLMLAVVYAAFTGGTATGMFSALISLVWLAWSVFLPGQVIVRTPYDRLRVILFVSFLPIVVILIGLLKRQAERGVLAEIASATLRGQLQERERLEQELREREQNFRLLFLANPLPMWVCDFGTLQILEVNQAALVKYGYSRDEFLSRRLPDFWPSEERAGREQVLTEKKQQLSGEAEWLGPARSSHVLRDGRIIEVEVTWHTMEFYHRPAVLAVSVDVTERVRAEDSLRASESLFRQLASLSPVGIFRTDVSGDCVYVNERWCRITGLPPREALGKGWATSLHPDDRERVLSEWYRSSTANRIFKSEYRFKRPDGGIIWVLGQAEAERNEAGQVIGYVGTVTDITERHQLEEERLNLLLKEQAALARAEAAVRQLTAIQSITDVAVAMLEPDQMLPELLRRLSEVLRTDTAMVLLLSDDGRQMQVRASHGLETEMINIPLGSGLVGRIAAHREPTIFSDLSQAEVISRPLREKVRSLMGAPLLAGDKVIGVIHVGTIVPRDFTGDDQRLLQLVAERAASAIERARLYEQVRAARDRLSHLSRQLIQAQETERRRIARELHDELGQSLTAVQFGLLAVQQQAVSETAAEALQQAIELVDDAIQLVRHLSVSLRPSALDDLGLAEAVRWHAERLRQRTGLDIEVTVTGLSERLPAEIETACFRVVQEALTNTVRHAQAQHVAISLQKQTDRLTLTISDDGRGFDPGRVQARASRGESMGLTGMRERVQLSGGQLAISSASGSGTEISVSFPLS
ncbi:MAG TPA: PAS domain S-box protein [Blastocatellia bacterium]|nr:PAS domain S-box protein [Blastocatellia bacterium]